MLAEQFDDFIVVRTLHQLFQGLVAFFFLLALFVHHLAMNQHEDCQTNQCQDGNRTAEMDNQCYEETDGERCSGSDEPTADNAEHTRNAEYRRITSPGTVGKRCTHGYHKGDVSGGKGKFQGSSQGDEQTSQYEIDGGANQVKSGAVGYDGFILLEACVHPPLAAFRHRFGYSVSQSHAEAYQRTGYRGTSEVLFTVILAGKVHGSLDNVVGFLGCAECINHNGACTDKEIPRGFGCTEE